MDSLSIGIVVSCGMLVLIVLGMRVAFATGLAGLVGLVWIFWSKKGYETESFFWALSLAAKVAGQVPHSKVSSQALSLIPTFLLIGYLAYYAGFTKALFEAAKRWVGCNLLLATSNLQIASCFNLSGKVHGTQLALALP